MLDLESEHFSNLVNWSSDAERDVKLMNRGVIWETLKAVGEVAWQGVLIKDCWMHCHANLNFYLVPRDHYIVDLYRCMIFNYSSQGFKIINPAHICKQPFIHPWCQVKVRRNFTIWLILWYLADIVKIGENCDIWLILLYLSDIVKFAWNCEIRSKLWILVEVVKFGWNCEIR